MTDTFKCSCYNCKRKPKTTNTITFLGKPHYFYCDQCFYFIKDYFEHAFLKSPMEV